MNQLEYVPIEIFITVIIAILGLILGGFWILVSKIMGVKERVVAVESQNLNDIKNIDAIWEEMNSLKDQRGKDVLLFTEAIHKLNLTLTKMDSTLENTNAVVEKMDRKLDEHGREIDRLKK